MFAAAALPEPSGSTVEVNLRVPSDVGCIEEVVDLILRHCCSGTWSSRRLRFNLRVAIAEALANAIVAGNREDRSKSVDVHAELFADKIRIHVTDQGRVSIPPPSAPLWTPKSSTAPMAAASSSSRTSSTTSYSTLRNSICMTLRRQ